MNSEFSCEACEIPDVVGLRFGQCKDNTTSEDGGKRQKPTKKLPILGKFADPLCEDVECPDGEVCRRGNCVAEKEKRCKPWETNINDECVDECEDVECPEGEICLQGECVVDEC